MIFPKMNEELPFYVYGIRHGERIIYVGRGSGLRAEQSAKEKSGEPFLIERHASRIEAGVREEYWIARLHPELNKRTGGAVKTTDTKNDVVFNLPHQINGGNVSFSLSVPIECAYTYKAIADALIQFVGPNPTQQKAKEFENKYVA